MRQWEDYFWPGQTVLANLLGEHDKLALQDAEYQITTMRQDEIARGIIAIDRTYDAAHLQALHRALFADVYDWAGDIREIGISKDFSEFAPPQRIGIYLNDVARVVRELRGSRSTATESSPTPPGSMPSEMWHTHSAKATVGR